MQNREINNTSRTKSAANGDDRTNDGLRNYMKVKDNTHATTLAFETRKTGGIVLATLLLLITGFTTVNVSAATITVNSLEDSVTLDAFCTLREALINANDDAVTNGDCIGGNGDDEIDFSVNGLIPLTFGQLLIDDAADPGKLIINGPGASLLTISGNDTSGVFLILAGGDTVIKGVTVAFGAEFLGGGINNTGTLTLINSTISANRNLSPGNGAGIYNNAGTVTLNESTVSDNLVVEGGSGIFNDAGIMILNNSTVSGNFAQDGAAGIANIGTMVLNNSTVSGNEAFLEGGGISNFDTITLNNSTVSGNFAATGGGGIMNTFGTVTLSNTIVAGNFAPASSEPDVFGTFDSHGYNLIGDSTGGVGFVAPGDQVGTSGSPLDPLLGPLQDNGGLTETHALLELSSAIDAGNNSLIPAEITTDQRGFLRIVNGTVDIGAFEFGNGVAITIDIKPGKTPNSINLASRQKIAVAIITAGAFDANQVDWETVLFGPNGATESHGRSHVKDIDDDGDMDLVLHFNTQDTGIQCGDTEATLTGEIWAGGPIMGTDEITTVNCP